MFVPYCEFLDDISVLHSIPKDGESIIVRFEEPYEEGFKVLECLIPECQIIKIVGFNDEEKELLLKFCECNKEDIMQGDSNQ